LSIPRLLLTWRLFSTISDDLEFEFVDDDDDDIEIVDELDELFVDDDDDDDSDDMLNFLN
jgi:hypothetical protein